MNIVFIGSSHFGEPALREILEAGYDISCVVTQPDRKKGRGLHLEGTVIKKAASALGLKIYQPSSINSKEAEEYLNSLTPDLFIVIAYGQILSKPILDIPKICSINVHASLLPKYRGAAPINWALIKGEKRTGISIIKMSEQMDAGEIILQKEIPIEKEDNVHLLENKLSLIATEALLESCVLIENHKFKLKKQDSSLVTFAPKLKKETGRIHWDRPVSEIHNLIRGCYDWPGAYTYYNGKLLKIFGSNIVRPVKEGYSFGEVIAVSKAGITVAAASGGLLIKELQIEGKRRMGSEEFITGHKITVGEVFGKK